MPAQALFGISVGFGFIAWGIVAAQYFWPLLRTQARGDALRPVPSCTVSDLSGSHSW